MTDTEEERWNAYLHSGTNVLRNKDDITSPEAWLAMEKIYTLSRAAALPELDFHQGLLVDHVRAIHFHLFQDCYEWAGEFRNVDMGKDNPFHPEGVSVFCRHEDIPDMVAEAQTFVSYLLEEAPNLSMEDKITMLAQIHSTLNYAHPFREGNGRSTRVFMDAIAEQAGIDLNFGSITSRVIEFASQLSMRHPNYADHRVFQKMYARIAAL